MEQFSRLEQEQAFNVNSIEEAFEYFNQASEHLSEFYKGLEHQVTLLNDQLQTAQRDRLRQYEEKERLANRLSNLLRVLPGGVVVLDGRGVVSDCNPAAVNLLGEPLMGELWRDVVDRCFDPRWDDGHDITLRDGRCVNISTQSLESEPGQILLIKDVTETRQLQEQFSQLKRLSAMGEMAASLAHQIRTPLSSAMLYASNLSRAALGEQVRHRFTDKIIQRLQNLESLVEDMLLFSRGGRLESRQVSAITFVHDTCLSLESNTAPGEHELVFSENINSGELNINEAALISAIQNLVNNAIESSDKSVCVHLNFTITEDSLNIRVSDNGPGIPERVRDRVLEPFFTTRSNGTGLGLAVVDSVIRAHSGKLTLESTNNNGTCFSIRLPLVAGQASASNEED